MGFRPGYGLLFFIQLRAAHGAYLFQKMRHALLFFASPLLFAVFTVVLSPLTARAVVFPNSMFFGENLCLWSGAKKGAPARVMSGRRPAGEVCCAIRAGSFGVFSGARHMVL